MNIFMFLLKVYAPGNGISIAHCYGKSISFLFRFPQIWSLNHWTIGSSITFMSRPGGLSVTRHIRIAQSVV